MNPRLNPDLVKNESNEKQRLAEPAEVRLPVTNSLYVRPIEYTIIPDLSATNGRHTAKGETQVALPETNSGTAATRVHASDSTGSVSAESTEYTSELGDEAPKEIAQSKHSLGRSSTRDSGTAMVDSPYLNGFVGKTSSNRTPSETILDVPPIEHARADSSTIGTAEAGRYSGSNYDTQAIESSDEEDEPTLMVTGGGFSLGDIPGRYPDGSEEALVATSEEPTADEQLPSDTASSYTGGTATAVEPIMNDAQLEVSDEFKPVALIHEEASEALISDEQLEVDDEFKPQKM